MFQYCSISMIVYHIHADLIVMNFEEVNKDDIQIIQLVILQRLAS